jgi:hypothetical protein
MPLPSGTVVNAQWYTGDLKRARYRLRHCPGGIPETVKPIYDGMPSVTALGSEVLTIFSGCLTAAHVLPGISCGLSGLASRRSITVAMAGHY